MIRKIDRIWEDLELNYKSKNRPIDFNFRNVVSTNSQGKNSNNRAHYIHPYPAKIFPYIPTFLLSIPNLCPIDGIVLDSFCGSGSVLLESIIHPFYKRNAYGVEINPLGRLISKVKTTPLDKDEINKRSKSLLDNIRRNNNKITTFPNFRNIEFWFSPVIIKKLATIKYSLDSLEDDDYKDFFYLCFSSIIRKVSRADPYIPPPVLLKINKYKNSPDKYKFLRNYVKNIENADVFDLLRKAIVETSEKVNKLNEIEDVREGRIKARIIWDDAKSIKKGNLGFKGHLFKKGSKPLRSNSIDLILTSPPYLTAQKYIRTQKLELLWLDMLSQIELDELQREIIGAERVSIKETDFDLKFGVESIDSIVNWAKPFSKERAATIIKYFINMRRCLAEIHRVLKNDAYCVIVVGNNRILGRYVETHKLLADLAIDSGFKLKVILKDKIRGRGMITKRHNTGGLIKEEYIIVLKKE